MLGPFQNNGIGIAFNNIFGVLEIRQKRLNHCGIGIGNGVVLGCHGNFGYWVLLYLYAFINIYLYLYESQYLFPNIYLNRYWVLLRAFHSIDIGYCLGPFCIMRMLLMEC